MSSDRVLRSRIVPPKFKVNHSVGDIVPSKSIPDTCDFPELISRLPPFGSFPGSQSQSGEIGGCKVAGIEGLQAAALVITPDKGAWTPLYHPMKPDTLNRPRTSPTPQSDRTQIPRSEEPRGEKECGNTFSSRCARYN